MSDVLTPAAPGRARAEAAPLPRHDVLRVVAGSGGGEDARCGEARESRPAARRTAFERILLGLRVLVVDDDPDVLELFAVALAACGADVRPVDNAREALALAREVSPHVIVSDIAMVGEDGYWLVREIRRLPEQAQRSVPVIATTAFGREHPRARALAAGFTEHLHKPIDPELLCRAVAKAAGR
jgi:CheY-like chemotaxis protein